MTRYLGPPSDARKTAKVTKRVTNLERRYLGFGARFAIKLASDLDTFDTDTTFIFDIPPDLNGLSLVFCRGYVTTVGSSGTELDVQNLTGPTDMLTTDITIDSGDLSSKAAATPPVIADPPDSTVADGDQVQIVVVSAGTGAMGLGAELVFG